MQAIRSYSKPLSVPHKFLDGLWDGVVYAQEKVDGSQISFGIIDGILEGRSRKQALLMEDTNDTMFREGVLSILSIQRWLEPGSTYRGEYLSKPKHNSLSYGRVPIGNIVLYDVDMGNQDYMRPKIFEGHAARIGLECVPLLANFASKPTLSELDALLDHDSILGGCKIEGIVLKNYSQIDEKGKVLMGKHVSPAFKEKHSGDWKKRHPSQNDIVDRLIEEYATEARWDKAIHHLTEQGELEGSMRDTPLLLAEINRDVLEECEDEIREKLFKLAWKKISRGLTRGFPEHYKAKLKEDFDK